MISITDGLHHHGSVEIENDINYLHGYGLKPINRIGLGFIAQHRFFKQIDGYLNPIVNRDFIVDRESIAISPKLGFIALPKSGRVDLYNRDFSLVSSVSTPSDSAGIKIGVVNNGDFLVTHGNRLSVIGVDGTIKKTNTHSIVTTTGRVFKSVHVDYTRDKFFFITNIGGSDYYHVGRYSTLEVIATTQMSELINFVTFLLDGKILTMTNSSVQETKGSLYEIDASTYGLTRLSIQSNTSPFNPVCYDYNGTMLCQSSQAPRIIYSSNTEDYSYQQIGTLPVNHTLVDADRNFFYTTVSTSGTYHVVKRSTMEIVFTYTNASTDTFGMPTPISTRGKMPQCRAFHK